MHHLYSAWCPTYPTHRVKPPELEIRDIGDLAVDHFRGIFRLTYAGDAHLVLKTKVQVLVPCSKHYYYLSSWML